MKTPLDNQQLGAVEHNLRALTARVEELEAGAGGCKPRADATPSIAEQAGIIASIVARRTGVPEQVIHSRVRNEKAARARQVCIALMRKFANISSADVGQLFERDRKTVGGADKVVQNFCDTDPEFKREYEEATAEVALALGMGGTTAEG
jgi:hypothetical protein